MGHHYVPKRYLKAFESADEPGLIWMYDKVDREFRKVPVVAAAQAPAFYDAETERKLNQLVEGPAQVALSRLQQKEQLRENERRAASLYMAVMLMRVPARRRRATELIPSTVEEVIGQVSAMVDEWASKPETNQQLVVRRRMEIENARAKLLADPGEEVIAEVRSPWPSQRVVDAVYGMTWRVVACPKGNPFLTSDNPAFFFTSLGLGRPESELTFPLTPDLALLANRQGPREATLTVQATLPLAREINRRLAVGAERFVFSDEPRQWIAAIARKKPASLRRVLW